jgi:hypothetical protein
LYYEIINGQEYGSEKAFTTVAYFMTVFVIMIRVCSEEALSAVSDFMAMLIIMIRLIRQKALMAENLLHGFLHFTNES